MIPVVEGNRQTALLNARISISGDYVLVSFDSNELRNAVIDCLVMSKSIILCVNPLDRYSQPVRMEIAELSFGPSFEEISE